MKILLLSITASLTLATTLPAAIVVNGDFTTVGGSSLQITVPITFNVTTSGALEVLAFDNWVTSDGVIHAVDIDSISYQINAGLIQNTSATRLFDNIDFDLNAITANDGFIVFAAIAVTAGDSITFFPGTFTNLFAEPGMNPALNGLNFTGDAFLTTGSFFAMSAPTSVGGAAVIPEPSTYVAIAGFAGLGLFLWRRRAKAKAA